MKCLHCQQTMDERSTSNFCCAGCESAYTIVHAHTEAEYGVPTAELFYTFDRKHFVFFVPNLRCASCLWLVRKHLTSVAGVTSIATDLSERTVTVGFAESEPNIVTLTQALRQIGYLPYPFTKKWSSEGETSHQRNMQKRIAIAGAAFANVMLFSAALYFAGDDSMPPALQVLFLWLSFALTLSSLWITAREFFRNAWHSLRYRRLHVDLPIVFALLVAFVASATNLARGSTVVYFDSICGLVFFLLVGRALHDTLLNRARSLIDAAPSSLPPRSELVNNGESVFVSPGEVFPADGLVEQGTSEVNEALLTGEPYCVTKTCGDAVFAGTQNLYGSVIFKVTACRKQTRLWQILEGVQSAAQHRAIFQSTMDRILPWFVAATFVLAILGFLIWFPSDPVQGAKVFVTTLIVCCPCALALAVPLTSTFYLRRAWKHGALIRSADALERLENVDVVVLDKTRTLTKGELKVTGLFGNPSQGLLNNISQVAHASKHPISMALSNYLAASLNTLNCKVVEEPGFGVSMTCNDKTICALGNARWIECFLQNSKTLEAQLEVLKTLTHNKTCAFATDGNEICAFALDDPIRDEAADFISRLKEKNVPILLASGDTIERVRAVADVLKIPEENARGALSPQEKLDLIANLQRVGHRVLFVGDGMNDAAAAKSASVSIAMGGSVDIAIASSDVALETTNLQTIADLLNFSCYAMRTIRLLLWASIFYNLIAVSFAFAGILHPLVAALIMPASSMTILLLSFARKGDSIWASSLSSCPSPLPSPSVHPLPFGEPQIQDNGTI